MRTTDTHKALDLSLEHSAAQCCSHMSIPSFGSSADPAGEEHIRAAAGSFGTASRQRQLGCSGRPAEQEARPAGPHQSTASAARTGEVLGLKLRASWAAVAVLLSRMHDRLDPTTALHLLPRQVRLSEINQHRISVQMQLGCNARPAEQEAR